MFKLLKYEFLGRYKYIVALFIIYVITSTYFIYRSSTAKIGDEGVYFVLNIVLAMAVMIIVMVASAYSFRSWIYDNTSYLIFTLPESGYSIIGAKLLSAILEFILFFCSSIVSVYLGFVYGIPALQLSESISVTRDELVSGITQQLLNNYKADVILAILLIILGFVELLLLIYFSITVSKIALKTKKFGKLVSFVVFIITSIVLGKGTEMLDKFLPYRFSALFPMSKIHGSFNVILGEANIASTVFNILSIAALFILSAYLLERKADI